MDSRTALERLDAVRVGSDDLSLPEMAGVGDVLASDAVVAAEYRHRQSWDRSVAASMHDVPIPRRAKERLLQRLSSTAEASHVVAAPRQTSRRRTLGMLSGVAASVAAAGLFWFVIANSAEPVTVVELQNEAAALSSGKIAAKPFHGDFTPALPGGNWKSLRTDSSAVGLLEQDGRNRAAAWRFTYGRNGRSRGVIVAIPVKDVASPPPAKRVYVGGNATAWTEGSFVYVCRVEGPIDELLHQLDDARLA